MCQLLDQSKVASFVDLNAFDFAPFILIIGSYFCHQAEI